MKKIITSIAIACMVGTMLAGCSKEQHTQPSTESVKETQSVESETKETTAPETEENTETVEDTKSEVTTVDITPGTNMTDAAELPLNAKASGTVESGETAWYSFTTGDREGVTYRVMIVNTTSGKDEAIVEGRVCDEYGDEVGGTSHFVYDDGTPENIDVEKASATTTYYISLKVEPFRDDTDYTIAVKPME